MAKYTLQAMTKAHNESAGTNLYTSARGSCGIIKRNSPLNHKRLKLTQRTICTMINPRLRNQRANIGHNIPESRIEHESINRPPEVPGPKERYNDDARCGDRERRADALCDGDGGHLLPTEMTAIFAHEILM